MARADLLALTPESLATLANVGLVKRAQRELAAGKGPTIDVAGDETVVGTFPDGVVTRLEPGKRLAECPCTCLATGACRHRVALVFAYRAAAPSPGDGGLGVRAADDRYKHTDIPHSRRQGLAAGEGDAALRAYLGPRLFEAARELRDRGVIVTVDGDVVHLPHCSVRFLVGGSLEYVRCDCAAPAACEHMAVAVWAREQARTGTFELAGGSERPSFTLDPALYTAFSELIAVLLEGGVTQPVATLAERFSRLRAAAGAATWLVSALDDVERLLEAYAARSARYDEAELVRLLAELASRARATRRAGAALPARWVLGIGEPAETQLERLRLVSLGARLAADGSARTARVYLADPDSGSVLVLERRWDFVGEPPLDGPELAKRSVVSGINLGALAHGQVVTLAARRTANLGLTIGSRKGTTSLLPGSADPSRFPASLHVTRYEPLRDRLERRPPRFLRPRVLAESLVALRVERVRALGYCAATQTQRAVIEDEAGDVAHVSLSHRAVAPHALDALAARLANNPRAVIGHVQPAAGALHVDPVAVVGDAGMVVLDLAGPTAAPRLPQIAPSPTSPLDEAVESAGHRLAEAAHRGLRRLPADYAARLLRDADRCERLGLSGFGGRLRTLATRPSAATWIDAAIWHGLL